MTFKFRGSFINVVLHLFFKFLLQLQSKHFQSKNIVKLNFTTRWCQTKFYNKM